MKDDRRARHRTGIAAVVLLAIAMGALVVLWPADADEVDERRASPTSVAGSRAGPQAPRVDLDATVTADVGVARLDVSAARADDPSQQADVGQEDGPPAEVGGVGRLRGRVAGPGDSVVAGAVVVAYARGRGREEPLRIEVDALGRFDAVVPATRYEVGAEAPGHVSGRFERANVTVDGVIDVGVVALRHARSTLSGRVFGAGQVPLAHATVFARGAVFGGDGKAVSAPDGAFAISGLPEGVYRVWARAPGHVGSKGQDVAVTEMQGGEATLQLESGGRLAGTITDPDGAPVPGASVFVYREGDRLSATEADAQGRFEVDGLPAGAAEVFARTGDYALSARAAVDVVAGSLVVRDVALSAGHLITGRVTDAQGAPVAGIHVLARALGGDVERAGQSDGEGRYSVVNLYPGRYRLGLARGGPRGPSGPARMVTEVDVTTGAATCDLVAPAGATVAGEVVRADGQPLANAQVFAIQDGEQRRAARSDDGGRFRIEGLPPGRCRLFVREDDDGLVARLEQDLAEDATVEGLRLLARPPARVRGRVVDPAGRPVPDLELVLRGVHEPVERSARTDADGRFELFPLYDGEYELEADPAPLLLLARRLDADRATLPGRRLAIAQGRDVAFDLRVALE